jgi:uncharacterized membrane protein YfcA
MYPRFVEIGVGQFVEILAFALVAGGFGALVGLGGGVLIVPFLTLVMRVGIRDAVAASLVAVIATSAGAASSYVRDGLSNLRVAIFLEVATTLGAVVGAVVAGLVSPRVLFVLFGLVLVYSAGMMLRRRRVRVASAPISGLDLSGEFVDRGTAVHYTAQRPALGFGLMVGAGLTSGLLGIGSGAMKVPAMDLAMRLPIKVSTATSNLMIGVTAAAGAVVFLMRGDLDPLLATPVAVGVAAGSSLGSRLLPRLASATVRRLFVAVLLVIAVQMIVRGVS